MAPVSLQEIASMLMLDNEGVALELCAALGLPEPVAGPDGEPAVSLLRLREGVRPCMCTSRTPPAFTPKNSKSKSSRGLRT